MTETPSLIPGMIDSHFHYIEMIKKGLEPEKLMPEYFASGLSAAVDISTSISNHDSRMQFALNFNNLFISSGISPGKADALPEDIEKMLAVLDTQIIGGKECGKTAAVGETGLDWYWKYGTREKQLFLFEKQLEMANKHGLPVIIHNREADRDIIELLRKKAPARGGVIHCFSSNYRFASSCIDCGFLISFAGNVTYNKNTDIQSAAVKIPLSSILVETDAPYLSPQAVRSFPNHPGYISHTYSYLADSRRENLAVFTEEVKTNFNRLFGKAV
jgi:TatD DNase family protein